MTEEIEEYVDAFVRFVGEVHQDADGRPREPFPWQSDLVRRVLTDERWPDAIDAPTGLGKTATLDAAVFLAAVRPDLARRRIFFVVDRRIVVDEAHEHASRLAGALARPRGPVSEMVAAALRQDGDDADQVLSVTRMRGGVTWERLWLERPDRHAIVTGTVDQIGSRLLFRGYGVANAALPIDAALVGTDSLILIDEAHLAEPFLASARAALAFASCSWAPQPVIVTLSATPHTRGRVHGIAPADEAHPVAGRRLRASKRLHLVAVTATKAKASAAMSQAIATLALRLAANAPVVGAVVNTVARARAVFDTVRQDPGVDAVLLTGRSRGVDRQLLLDAYYPRIKANRSRSSGRALIVVATQTVEVGANIDLDALVTESAAWPALVQRLGRLNRLGYHTELTRAVVVHDQNVDAEDYVYGPARLATWHWLATHTEPHMYTATLDPAGLEGGLPASPAALRGLAAHAPTTVQPAQPYTPLLLHSILQSWTRTAPIPHPDTPVAPFLHGITNGSEPVSVIWRSDLIDLPFDGWPEAIDALPPSAGEAIDVSTAAVRRWLNTGIDEPTVTDVDAAADVDDTSQPAQDPNRVRDDYGRPLVAAYSTTGDTRVIPATDIRPGMTIVVPSEYGGCDEYGWHPQSTTAVLDVADVVERHGGGILRIGKPLAQLATSYHPAPRDPGTFAHALAPLLKQAATDQQADLPLDTATYAGLFKTLAEAGPDSVTPLGRTLRRLAERQITATPWPNTDDQGPQRAVPWRVLIATKGTLLTEDDTAGSSSAGITPLALSPHQQAVADRAREFAANLHLPENLVETVSAAALYHDEGKRDPRFQAMLHRGRREDAEIAEEPLAKSGMDPADRAAFRRAWRRSGYPRGLRHEELSQRIAALRLTDTPGIDLPLTLHLVASHHGRARPLMPPATDPRPADIPIDGHDTLPSHAPIDWNAVDRFAALNSSYGPWGLALLETIVRLADVWASTRNEGADA